MKNKTSVLFEKKLGSWLLLELLQNNETGELTLTLYKKWNNYEGFEATENVHHFAKEERLRACTIYDTINLKNVYKRFKKLKKEL